MTGWAAGISLLLSVAVAPAAREPAARSTVDPFYLDLLREGIQTYDRGEYFNAARQLRLACFGLLDDPPQLAGCLTRLALAQGAAGNAEGFRDTFHRIAEVEELFGAYSKATLPADVRNAFEQRVLALIPVPTLEAMPAWKTLLSRQLVVKIAALPPRERRRQLEERLAREPKSLEWNLMLADLDLAEDKTAAAIARAEQVALLGPQDPRALCLRGLARAAGKRCAEALADLEPCPLRDREPRYAAALLSCRVELAQWSKAEEQLRALPPALQQERKIASLAARVKQHASAPTPPASSPPPAPTASNSASAAKQAPAPPGPPVSPAANTAPAARPAPTGKLPERPPAGSPGAGVGSGATAGSPSSTAGATNGGAATPGGRVRSVPSAAPPDPPSATERAAMVRARHILDTQSQVSELREALRLAREVADAHPDAKEAQYLAGEAAYRNARWKDAAGYFRRAGEPGNDRPDLLFYFAVSLYEMGDQPAAAALLRRSLPNLKGNAYIDSYAKRILGASGQ
ncbi:MAG TPA: hypothetical protein VHR45_06650 [Thermoanaerobaculia bacterium]|nr:hypothetical protein [Thermoanaerobaculia bacterium]